MVRKGGDDGSRGATSQMHYSWTVRRYDMIQYVVRPYPLNVPNLTRYREPTPPSLICWKLAHEFSSNLPCEYVAPSYSLHRLSRFFFASRPRVFKRSWQTNGYRLTRIGRLFEPRNILIVEINSRKHIIFKSQKGVSYENVLCTILTYLCFLRLRTLHSFNEFSCV